MQNHSNIQTERASTSSSRSIRRRHTSRALVVAILAILTLGTMIGGGTTVSAAHQPEANHGPQPMCPDGRYDLTFQSPAYDTVNNNSSNFDANLSYWLCSGTPVQGAIINISIISGPNTGYWASHATDANGDSNFHYVSTYCGEDVIQASYGSLTATVTDDWSGCDDYKYNLWISNWGYVTHVGGLSVTPDMWVPQQGNTCADTSSNNPVINSTQNVLCVRLHNDGSPIYAGQATLTAGFRPCCITGTYQTFEAIQNSANVPLPVPAVATGTTTVISVPWTLSGTDDDGGAWGGYTNSSFHHFCAEAIINLPTNEATRHEHRDHQHDRSQRW